jgi:hypothetical protein
MAGTRQKGSRAKFSAATLRAENRKRSRKSLQDTLREASNRAHDSANRRIPKSLNSHSIHASIETHDTESIWKSFDLIDYFKRLISFMFGLLLLPFAWVTLWTFFSRLSHATVHQHFWKSSEFWHFIIGSILLSTWLLSGFFRNFFLYLYVLGHELTHAIFVFLHLGKVSRIHVSTSGGYITTNKTNLLIALSPYFVPFYSVAVVLAHLGLKHFGGISEVWDPLFHALIGATWTFHMIWTIWMLPKDQPDLQQNGTFLSLVVILLGNSLVLSALVCAADDHPLHSALEFAREWATHTAHLGGLGWRSLSQAIELWLQGR